MRNPGKEGEIWQRVLEGREQEPSRTLGWLYSDAREEEGALTVLTEGLRGKARELAALLLEGCREKEEILLGLMELSGGEVRKNGVPGKPPREGKAAILRRCYRRCCRNVAEYTARIPDPEFGTVFKNLAEKEEGRCVLMARLAGVLRAG